VRFFTLLRDCLIYGCFFFFFVNFLSKDLETLRFDVVRAASLWFCLVTEKETDTKWLNFSAASAIYRYMFLIFFVSSKQTEVCGLS
jgi:hypothetical protein